VGDFSPSLPFIFGVIMKKLFLIVCGLLFLVFPIACASLPVPTGEALHRISHEKQGITLSDLQTGRKNYVGHCAACHNLYFPSAFSPADWNRILVRMQKKAKIDDEMTDSIGLYLLSMTTKSEKADP
jgi:hypothetical protein